MVIIKVYDQSVDLLARLMWYCLTHLGIILNIYMIIMMMLKRYLKGLTYAIFSQQKDMCLMCLL